MGLSEYESKMTESVERLSDSVVTIRSSRLVNQFPFGATPVRGAGSGIILDPSGRIVTNYHVVDGATAVEVTLNDGRTFAGRVIGGDRATDVVLVKINGDKLTAAKLGDSEKLKVGQMALAIGNSLDLPGGPTLSTGVISALGRPMPWADLIFEGLIQTDAAINPGNSGGPLADSDGNVIGMNTAIVPYAQGVGFAIPINMIKWVIEQLNEKGRVIRPVLGASVIAVNPMLATRFNLSAKTGVLIADVLPQSPAYNAGLQGGDMLEKIETYAISTVKELLVALSRLSTDKDVTVRFVRGNKKQEVRMRLAEAAMPG